MACGYLTQHQSFSWTLNVATTFSKGERFPMSNGSENKSTGLLPMLDDTSELCQQQGCSQNIPQAIGQRRFPEPQVKKEAVQETDGSSTKSPGHTVKLRITAKAKQHLPPECISSRGSAAGRRDSPSPSELDFPQQFREGTSRKKRRLAISDSSTPETEGLSEAETEGYATSEHSLPPEDYQYMPANAKDQDSGTSASYYSATKASGWKTCRSSLGIKKKRRAKRAHNASEEESTSDEASVDVNSMHVRIIQKLMNDVSLCGKERNYLQNLLVYSKKNIWRRRVDEMTMTDYCNDIEDDETTKTEWCNREILRDNPDMGRIQQLMDVTFPWRRDLIISRCPEVYFVLNRFSIFRNQRQLCEEFKRITKPYVHSKYLEQIAKYYKRIIKCAPKSDLRDEIKSILCFHRNAGNDNRYVGIAGAILLLPSYFGENVNDFIAFETKGSIAEYPHIICRCSVREAIHGLSSFSIYADGMKLYEHQHLPEAFFILLAVYYVFNIEYPVYVLETAMLAEGLLLHISSCSRETKRVMEARRFLQRTQQ